MRYLFIHPVFPGQFHRVMERLAAKPGNEVVHISRQSSVEQIPGVRKARYTLKEGGEPKGHVFARKLEDAIQHGQAVLAVAKELRTKGFVPDLIYGYAGWGHIHFMKDLFPAAPLVGYFEWFLNAHGSEYNFDPAFPLQFEHQLYMRTANAPALVDLAACDHGVTPTRWQRHQFPAEFHGKLTVIHDGIDTEKLTPKPGAGLKLPTVELPAGTPLVTYVTRGMEPFRGFPQFMRALAELQTRRPDCHAVIVGTETIYYSQNPPDGRTYKQIILDELNGRLDLSRIHFTGWLDTPAYLSVLQASWAHVYFTRPYVLSWSLLEAMSAGCLVIGSRTAPLEEVIRDGENGRLVDFFEHRELADALAQALADPARFAPLRQKARATILQSYSLDLLVNRHVRMLESWAAAPARQRDNRDFGCPTD